MRETVPFAILVLMLVACSGGEAYYGANNRPDDGAHDRTDSDSSRKGSRYRLRRRGHHLSRLVER